MSEIFTISAHDPRSYPEELLMYSVTSEPQLKHRYEPEPGIFIAESTKVIERAMRAGYEPMSMLMYPEHIFGESAGIIDAAGNIPVFTGTEDEIVGITGFKLIRGALCAMRRRELPSPEKILAGKRRIAVLENVTNPTNIGAVFRSAAALGMEAVLLTSDCCDPLYRRSSRVSMGTVFQVPWTYLPGSTAEPEHLRSLGFASAAMALVNDSVDIDDLRLRAENKLAVILGNEGYGLSPETIRHSDYTVCIPMSNDVDSLNVAASSAVAFWQLGK